MKNKRKLITCIFTLNTQSEKEKIKTIGEKISRTYGGVTIIQGTDSLKLYGFWSESSDLFLAEYPGDIELEEVSIILLSVLPSEEEKAISNILNSLKSTKNSLSSKHIHIEVTNSTVNHYKL